MLGSSWMTSIVGYAVIVITVAQQIFSESPIPSKWYDWLTFFGKLITGVGIALAKDFNVSNASKPLPTAAPVNPAPPTT